jgi:hypothetical protein
MMKLLVIYRPDSEYASAVEAFIRDFQHNHEGLGRRMEILNADSRDGSAMMSIYDLFEHPAILALQDNGQVSHQWVGKDLPLMDEVASYFYTTQT